MSSAYAASARAFRAAMRKEDFPEPAWRILDVLVWLSHENGRCNALVPAQILFAVLCGRMSKGKVSETLDWLEECRVIVRARHEVNYGGRKYRWTLYTLEIPEKWRLLKPKVRPMPLLPRRVEDSQLVRDAEQWLAQLDVSQQELLPPPPSLDEFLREDFVERADTLFSTGHGNPSQPKGSVGRIESAERETGNAWDRADRIGSPVRDLGGIESKSKSFGAGSHLPMVPREGTKVETEGYEESAMVPSGGTSPVPSQGTSPVVGSLPGNSPGSPAGNFVGGRGDFESKYSSREVRTDNSNRVHRIERARAEVPPQGTQGVRKGSLHDFLSDAYIREKLSRNQALSYELVNGVNRAGKMSLLSQWFGELYNEKPQRARALLSESLSAVNPNGWLNRSVRVELGFETKPNRGAE